MSFKAGRFLAALFIVSLLIQMHIAANGHAAAKTKIVFTSTRGGNRINLTQSPRALNLTPNWSNDGTRIVCDRQEPDGTSDIYVINTDGSGTANLTGMPRVEDYSAAWRLSGLSVPRAERLPTSWGELKRKQ